MQHRLASRRSASYVLVPGVATSTTADVWIGAFDREPSPRGDDAELVLESGQRVAVTEWLTLETQPHFAYARVTLTPSKRREAVRLIAGGRSWQTVRVATLPRTVEGGVRVVLGSCFDLHPLKRGQLRAAVESAFHDAPPDLKVLCGDQVYLDPLLPTLSRTLKGPEEGALDIYRSHWTHDGFGALLSDGPNFLSPDDHEFWNDYTVTQRSGDPKRAQIADELCKAFQAPESLRRFSIGELRVLIADTRLSRTDPGVPDCTFMKEAALDELVGCLGEDQGGPAVLVLTQPIFGQLGLEAGKRGSDIPEYRRQFERLAEAILTAPSAVVLLTGDLHFGRVTRAKNLRGKQLVEVIASPLELGLYRSATARLRPWRPALATFPNRPEGSVPLETVQDYRMDAPHFVTIDFDRNHRSGAVRARIRAWPVTPTPAIPRGKLVLECDL